MNEKKNEKKPEGVTLNGVIIHGVGIHAITRKGNLATESLGFGVALMVEGENGRTRLRLLADLLKGCRSLEGAAYEKYTAEAFTEARALVLASDLSTATGVPLLPKDAEAIKALKDKAEAMKAEAAKKGEEGEEGEEGEKGEKGEGKKEKKAKKAKKTTAQRIADILNAIGGTIQARATPLIDALATLDPLAAMAAKCAIEGGTPEDVAILLEKARKARGEAAAQAAKK